MKRSAYSALLTEFQDAILHGHSQTAASLFRAKPSFAPEAQLSVYSSGYRLRLTEVVREDYPALRHYLGAEQFDTLALRYVESTPSQHFNIEKYPWGFAQYVNTHADIFAGELAQLERAISMVYRMEDSEPANLSMLTQNTPEALGNMRFPLRTAHQLLSFTYPVNAYLIAFREGAQPAPPPAAESYVMVWRHNNTVQRCELEKTEFQLLRLLASNHTLAEALQHPHFIQIADMQAVGTRLQKWFERWLLLGMIAAC